MTRQQLAAPEILDGVVVDATPQGFAAIGDPGCAAAIWDREPPDGLLRWIDRLDTATLPRARTVLRPDAVQRTMTEVTAGCGMPDCDERRMLIDDVATLAQIFAALMDAPYLRLRLDVISTNACRKFHIDSLTSRLICTYRGSSTQYGVSREGRDPDPIHSAGIGRPIVLRGTLWPAENAPNFVHRSPPIEGTGETRLLLVLDPVIDLEEAQREEFLH
ncbi:MAG: DUF1826 domain-containing protein [Pseudomonadota bacterium]